MIWHTRLGKRNASVTRRSPSMSASCVRSRSARFKSALSSFAFGLRLLIISVLVGSGCIISSRVVGIDPLSSCLEIKKQSTHARAISLARDARKNGEKPANR